MTNRHLDVKWARCVSGFRQVNQLQKGNGRLLLFSARPALPSQPQSIIDLLPVPSYTAWWQRHLGVNNLPKVVTQCCPEQDLNPGPIDRKSNAPAVAPPRHAQTYCRSINFRWGWKINYQLLLPNFLVIQNDIMTCVHLTCVAEVLNYIPCET